MNGSYGYLVMGGIALFVMGFALGALSFGGFGAPSEGPMPGGPAAVPLEGGVAAVPPSDVPLEQEIATANEADLPQQPGPVLGGDGRPPAPRPADPQIERSGFIALVAIMVVCGIVIVFAIVRYLLMNAPRGAGA